MNAQTVRQTIALRQGIDAVLARQLVREIRDSKLKVQAAVQGGELRVTGKKRDDLQDAIALVRGLKIEQPLGGSQGGWDEGRGEVDDALAVVQAFREPGRPLVLAGFSFGGYVAAAAARRLPDDARATQLVLVAPAVVNFPVDTVPSDTLVFHGEADDVVPLSAALDWARPQTLPITVLPGVGHFFHGQLALLKQLIVRSWPH